MDRFERNEDAKLQCQQANRKKPADTWESMLFRQPEYVSVDLDDTNRHGQPECSGDDRSQPSCGYGWHSTRQAQNDVAHKERYLGVM